MTRIKSRKRPARDQSAVVNNRTARVRTQPARGLPIRDQLNVAVVWKILCERPQTVAKLVIVPKAVFHIAVRCPIFAPRRRKPVSRCSPPRAPLGIITIYPSIHNINPITVSYKFLQSQTGESHHLGFWFYRLN